jgi:hypothetical protein
MTLLQKLSMTLVVLSLSACASTSPSFSKDFGNEARTILAQQTRNPDAATKNKDKIPDGIDGKAARQTLERYQKSFGDPPRNPNSFTIGVGGGESR